jgi:hypothetical protein
VIPTYRVSAVASYKRWRDDPDQEDVSWLINQITGSEQTPAMAKGTAFHKFLENSLEGTEHTQASVDGYRFIFNGNFELYRPPTREWRKGKDYGGIIISGQCDCIEAGTIYDDKTTEYFDAEKYLEGMQHKFYMDIFGAQRFVWNVWTMKLDREDAKTYEVTGLHHLTQYTYPDLTKDCTDLAQEFKAFAEKYLPQPVTT